ncbi:MAG: GtrA family protein [Bacilli bacterium]|nr:GtrA family protein [Bacilli bacterium]
MKNKKQIILYIIFGIITSIINVLCFYILINLKINYQIANLITLILVKLIAYICSKKFVFKSKCNSTKELISEFLEFMFWRGFTLIIDYFGLIFLVEIFNMDETMGKIIVTITVIIINYITSKLTFNKNEKSL